MSRKIFVIFPSTAQFPGYQDWGQNSLFTVIDPTIGSRKPIAPKVLPFWQTIQGIVCIQSGRHSLEHQKWRLAQWLPFINPHFPVWCFPSRHFCLEGVFPKSSHFLKSQLTKTPFLLRHSSWGELKRNRLYNCAVNFFNFPLNSTWEAVSGRWFPVGSL